MDTDPSGLAGTGCEECSRLKRWKYAVVGALNPLRAGDPIEAWGADLGDPNVAVAQIEAIRAQRDAAVSALASRLDFGPSL